jgi:hypothetical protein
MAAAKVGSTSVPKTKHLEGFARVVRAMLPSNNAFAKKYDTTSVRLRYTAAKCGSVGVAGLGNEQIHPLDNALLSALQ